MLKLLTFLGTGDYSSVNYFLGEAEYESQYIQLSLAKMLTAVGEKEGREEQVQLVVFLTDQARAKNWEGEGRLRERLQSEGIDFEEVSVPRGGSNDEIWEIFNIVLSTIGNGERIAVDITHAFRSLPVIMTAVLNFAKVERSIDVMGMFYGAFDVREEGRAPVFDISPVDEIIEWSYATERMLTNGDAAGFRKLALEPAKKVLSQSREKDPLMIRIREIASALDKLSEALRCNNGRYIGRLSRELAQKTEGFEANDGRMVPFQLIARRLQDELQIHNQCEESVVMENLRAAKLMVKFRLYPQAFTFLQENILTMFCLSARLDHEITDQRAIAMKMWLTFCQENAKILGIMSEEPPRQITEAEIVECGLEMADFLVRLESFRNIWSRLDYRGLYNLRSEITSRRNYINHCSFSNGMQIRDVRDLEKEIEKYLQRFEVIFKEWVKVYADPA